MYEHVSVCIGFSYELYPVHMCMYVLKRPFSYSMIQSDMHLCRSAYLLVFECILSQHTCRYAPVFEVHIFLYVTVFFVCIHSDMHLLAHPFSPSCFLPISAHQAPILVSIVSFQSTARRHRSMRLNPLRLPLRGLALAAARAAARAAAPAAAVSSSSPPRAIMALMSTGPATAAAVKSTPKIELLESTPIFLPPAEE
jgi:hypothetical protein